MKKERHLLVESGEVVLQPRYNGEKIVDYFVVGEAKKGFYPVEMIFPKTDSGGEYELKSNELWNSVQTFNSEKQVIEETFHAALKSKESILAEIRNLRNELLSETDWIAQRHIEQSDLGVEKTLTDVQYVEFLGYRQELRNWANNCADYNDCTPPEKPIFL